MTTAARKSVTIHDYPEHLNPFREEDNHNKIRFWTIGRRLSRSNSINFSGIKDLKNSWALRSFMKKGKKSEQSQKPQTPSQGTKTNHENGDSSPIVFRRAIQYSSMCRKTVGSPERYVYGGSVTPLPRSRFQERLRSSSHHEVDSLSETPRMARSEFSGSRLSVESSNPFDQHAPVPPVRASRRKKKKAPAPPANGTGDVSIDSKASELRITEVEEKKTTNTDGDLDLDEMNLNIELKIVEDEDVKIKNGEVAATLTTNVTKEALEVTASSPDKANHKDSKENPEAESICLVKNSDSENDILNSVSFPKIDIAKYRRNSSVNEDDIKLRRGNLEDFHSLTNKRSKSLNNTMDAAYVTYDINLNESTTTVDKNGNDEPHKVVCKLYDDTSRKQSIDTISSTEKEFNEIDKVRREFEREINKLNAALEDDFSRDKIATKGARLSVSDIKKKFDNSDVSSPNPIPKPRRSHYGESLPANGNIQT